MGLNLTVNTLGQNLNILHQRHTSAISTLALSSLCLFPLLSQNALIHGQSRHTMKAIQSRLHFGSEKGSQFPEFSARGKCRERPVTFNPVSSRLTTFHSPSVFIASEYSKLKHKGSYPSFPQKCKGRERVTDIKRCDFCQFS